MSSGRVAIAVCACLVGGRAVAAPNTEEKLEILTQEVEQLKAELNKPGRPSSAASPAGAQATSSAHAHARAPTVAERRGAGQTFVGSYGEMHYNNWESKSDNIDFNRFILFVGHNFTDRIRFFSELELEHAWTGPGKPGEVELEQGYLELDLNENHALKAGLFLVPVGIVNETHEPPTFYGVERNPVETYVIPTTWWEGGVALSGKLTQGLSYDAALSSGLAMDGTFTIKESPQKVADANGNDGAVSYRLRWNGLPGVDLAATAFYQGDVTQQNGSGANSTDALLLETHAAISKGPFGLRALYAQWDIGGDAAAAAGKDKQYGWYVEPSFKVSPKLGVFARYNELDLGGTAAATKANQTNVGVNYWPHENVVFKADVQQQGKNGNADGFNLGVGYMF